LNTPQRSAGSERLSDFEPIRAAF